MRPVHQRDQLGVTGHVAAERGEGLTEPCLAEAASDRPGERSGHAGQRLADVGVAPHRLRVAAVRESATGDRACLHDPGARLVAGELHVPGGAVLRLEAPGDVGEIGEIGSAERRLVGRGRGHLLFTVRADDAQAGLVGDGLLDGAPLLVEADDVGG